MFAHWLGISKIMIVLNQAIKKLFVVGFSDLSELNRMKLFDCGDDGCLVDIVFFNFLSRLTTTRESLFSWRKLNVAFSVDLEHEHESSADSIFQGSIGLNPVTFTADSL
jgi:hypothetical protein